MSVDGDRAASDRSDAEREKDKDTERSRDNDKEREESDQPAEEYKIFVGGISWHMDDRELKDSELQFSSNAAIPWTISSIYSLIIHCLDRGQGSSRV